MRILVTGIRGQLGYDVVKELVRRGMEAVGVGREEMDITDADAVERVITDAGVQAVIHCAAYNAVDKAEDDADNCRKTNVDGTRNIATVCRKLGIKMLYVSTDYVFDGNKQDIVANLKKRKQSIKRNSILTFCAVGLSFVWVFATVFLTGCKEQLSEFNHTDWIIFSIMCVLEVLTVIAMFTFAIKARRGNPVALEKQIYEIHRTTIETTPLLESPGELKAVLTDAYYSHRITLHCNCIENNNESFHYNIEIFDEDFNLKFLYQSEFFESGEKLEMFKGCLDITEEFT